MLTLIHWHGQTLRIPSAWDVWRFDGMIFRRRADGTIGRLRAAA